MMPGKQSHPGKDKAGRKSSASHANAEPLMATVEGQVGPESGLSSGTVLKLQQAIGNRATVRQINRSVVSPDTIQRDYINQEDKVGAVKGAIGDQKLKESEKEAVSQILKSIIKYQKLDSGVVTAEKFTAVKNALKNILSDIDHYQKRFSEPVAQIMRQLRSEVQVVVDDWLFAQWLLADMSDPQWKTDADNVGDAVRELDSRIKKYNAFSARQFNNGIVVILDKARQQATAAMREWVQRKDLPKGGFEYGDKQGQLNPELAGFMKDYEGIERFLANKAHVLKFMRWLSKIIAAEDDKVTALKMELSRVEAEAGFRAGPVVPLGILPADAFFGLLAEGHVLDDYGAGLQHGELSHRLQWYAIFRAWNIGELEIDHTPIELYRRLGQPPFSQSRTGSSMWGYLLDSSISPNEPSYRFPGTLNRDLVQSNPAWDRSGPGQHGYREVKTYQLPDTEGLEPLGEALAQLKEIRTLELAKTDKGALESDQWQRFGTPTAPAVEAKKKELLENGYGEYRSGIVESKSAFSSKSERESWQVLIKHN